MTQSIEINSEITNVEDVYMIKSIIKTPQIAMAVNSFCLDGVLIDTGSQSMKKEFQSFFKQSDFDQVMLTHFHEDHTGNAAYIQKKYDVPIYIHQMSTHLTKQPQRIPLYRKAVWGDVEPFSAKPLKKSFESRTDFWEVIDTPGHSADHVAFYNRSKGILFTGDLFVTPRPKVILLDENILDTMDSLRKIQSYTFDQMFCGHTGLVKNPQKMIQQKIDYLEEIEGKALALQKQGKDVYEITDELFNSSSPMIDGSNTEWSAVHMIRTFLNRG